MPPVTPSNVVISGYSYDSFRVEWTQTDSAATSWNINWRKTGQLTWQTTTVTSANPYYAEAIVVVQGSSGANYAGNQLDIVVQAVNNSSGSSSPSSVKNVTLLDNPLVSYPLNGDYADISFNQTHATPVGPGTMTPFPNDAILGRKVLYVDGGANYATASNIIASPGSTSYTKMAWVNFSQAIEAANIISSSTGGGTNSHTLWVTHNTNSGAPSYYALKAGHGAALNYLTSSTLFPLNTWVHVALTYNNSTKVIKMFMNGVVVASTTLATAFAGTTDFNLGSYAGGSSTMKGYLSRVKWFNFEASEAQVKAVYNLEVVQRVT